MKYYENAFGEAAMSEGRFVILKEDHQNFVSFGHVARPLTVEEARAEAASLAKRYPDSTFHIFADCGAAVHADLVSIDLKTPPLSTFDREAVTAFRSAAIGR